LYVFFSRGRIEIVSYRVSRNVVLVAVDSSLRLCAWLWGCSSFKTAGRIYRKFGILWLTHVKFDFIANNSDGHFSWRFTCTYACVSIAKTCNYLCLRHEGV
jgi:hypothetical protein